MRTAVWMVMCNEPVIRAPANGWESANSARKAIRPGISCSARRISLRPNSLSERSATRWSSARGQAGAVMSAPWHRGASWSDLPDGRRSGTTSRSGFFLKPGWGRLTPGHAAAVSIGYRA